MTTPHWYVDTYILEGKPEAFDKIRKALENYQTTYTKYIPFSERQEGLDSVFNPYQLNLVYGTHGFVRNMQNTFGKGSISPYITESEMECTHYYPKLPAEWLLNAGCFFVPFGMLAASVATFCGHSEKMFVRPNSGFKSFIPTQIDTTRQYKIQEGVKEIADKYQVTPDTLCLVAYPRELSFEIRYVIVDREVVSASYYRLNGKHYLKECLEVGPYEAKRLAERMAAHAWQPDVAYMCDIALTYPGLCKIVELNAFCCAGLYECDYDKVFKAVTEAYMRREA